jgi:hypothetical protein
VEASVDEGSEDPPQKKRRRWRKSNPAERKVSITKLNIRLGSHINKKGGGKTCEKTKTH